jgi:hypothetical protein
MQVNRGRFPFPVAAAGALVLALTLLVGGVAAAQDKAAAKKHFDNGVELMGLEDFAGAAVEFEASVEVYQTRSAMFNLAMCYKAMHRYGPALETFRSVLKTFGDEMNVEMKKEVRDNIAAINKLIGEVEIHTSVPGALVLVDGVQSGATPLSGPLVLGAGEHRIRVSLQGYADQERIVTLVSGGREVVSFELAPAGYGAAPPPPVYGGSAPPPPVHLGTAPPPPSAAGPRVLAGPPPEIGRIFKLFGIRAGVQAGLLGVVSLGVLLSTSDIEYPGLFGITLGISAAGGGLISWGIGDGGDDYRFPVWGAFIGSIVGAGAAFGLDLGAYYAYGADFDEMNYEEATNVVTIAILVTVILPPAVEAGSYALFRRPDPERYPDRGKQPAPAPAADGTAPAAPGADGAAPAAPPPPPTAVSLRWNPPVPAAFADPDTGRVLYGFSFGAAF